MKSKIITIHGIAKNPNGRGYIEVRTLHQNTCLLKVEYTGVVFATQAQGIAVTTEKNMIESHRIESQRGK